MIRYRDIRQIVIIASFIILLMISIIPAFASAATIQYTYDDDGQVTKAAYDAMTIEYTYDNSGNKTSKNTCTPARLMRAGAVYGNYSTLQAAHDAANDGDIIQSRAIAFTENLTISKAVTFDGGHDCGYASHIGKTRLIGNITISTGPHVVNVDNFNLE